MAPEIVSQRVMMNGECKRLPVKRPPQSFASFGVVIMIMDLCIAKQDTKRLCHWEVIKRS